MVMASLPESRQLALPVHLHCQRLPAGQRKGTTVFGAFVADTRFGASHHFAEVLLRGPVGLTSCRCCWRGAQPLQHAGQDADAWRVTPIAVPSSRHPHQRPLDWASVPQRTNRFRAVEAQPHANDQHIMSAWIQRLRWCQDHFWPESVQGWPLVTWRQQCHQTCTGSKRSMGGQNRCTPPTLNGHMAAIPFGLVVRLFG